MSPKKEVSFKSTRSRASLIEVLLNYKMQKKYLLHEFVVMPDHFHLFLTPTGIALERAMQFVKGGFSFRLNKALKVKEGGLAAELSGPASARLA